MRAPFGIRHSRHMSLLAVQSPTLPYGPGFIGGARVGATSVFARVLIASDMGIGAARQGGI